MCVFFLLKLGPQGPQRGPNWTQNQVFGPFLSPGPNVGPRDPKPKRCGPKNHAEPRLQNSKWCHMVQVMAKNHFGQARLHSGAIFPSKWCQSAVRVIKNQPPGILPAFPYKSVQTQLFPTKWCQGVRGRPIHPHAPGARMTVVTQTPSNKPPLGHGRIYIYIPV